MANETSWIRRLAAGLAVSVPLILSGCASLEAAGTGVSAEQSGYALAVLTSIEMRRLHQDEIVRETDDQLIITNACGKAEADFRVLDATYPTSGTITAKETIGEWCKPPYDFERTLPYFLVVSDGEVKASWPVLYTFSGKMAIDADPTDLDYLSADLGLPVDQLKVSDMSADPIELEDYIDPTGEDIKKAVEEDESLAFAEHPDGVTVLTLTKGVLLGPLFPSFSEPAEAAAE